MVKFYFDHGGLGYLNPKIKIEDLKEDSNWGHPDDTIRLDLYRRSQKKRHLISVVHCTSAGSRSCDGFFTT